MASLRSYNEFIAQRAATGLLRRLIYRDLPANGGVLFTGSAQLAGMHICGRMDVLPALPSGITAFVPVDVASVLSGGATGGAVLIGRKIVFGSIDLATGTFTDGAAMPTRTEGNTSRKTWSPIWGRVTTVLVASGITLTATYKDQDDNAAEAASAVTITTNAPVESMGCFRLNGTDVGANDVTACVRSGGTSGVIELFGIDPIALLPGASARMTSADLLLADFNLVHCAAGDEIIAILLATSTVGAMWGWLNFVGDT